MKKIFLLCCLLFSVFAISQSAEKKVWDLLLANKKPEARKLFDKDLKSQMDKKIDYLILDAMIDMESGKTEFDDSFVKKFSKFPESNYYYNALVKAPFVMDDMQTLGFNDYSYKKIDFMAKEPYLQNNSRIIYTKAVADRNRKNLQGFKEKINELNVVTDWQFCGVFENLNDSGLDIEYEPEVYPKNDKLFDANSNGKLGWYIPAIPHHEGYQMYENESEYGNGIMYAQTFVDNPEQREVYFSFGSGSSIKLFLNDIELYANNDINQSDLEAFKLKVVLPKGTNRLLVKSSVTDGNDYFILSITDLEGKKIDNLTYQKTYKPYQKSTLEELNPVEVKNVQEEYITQKIVENPDNVLYKILLYETYMHNKKLELAEDIIEALDLKYPNSSLIKLKLANYHALKGDGAKSQEILKNMELQDPNYYYNVLSKIEDDDWMQAASIEQLEKLRDTAKEYPTKTIYNLFDFMITARNGNVQGMITIIDTMIANSNNSEFYITSFAPIYDSLEKDKGKTISLLENLFKTSDNYRAYSLLLNYYKAANRKDEVRQMILDQKNKYPHLIDLGAAYIDLLIEEKKYEEALVEIDRCLGQFPYSFNLMQTKGMVYNNMSDVKQAEKYFRQSLSHYSSNSSLRKTLYDITKVQDEIDLVKTKDVYKFIKEKRNSKLKSDYGVNILLDEYIINVLPEGGRKSKVTMVYEITAENGIEELKEYGLNTYGISLLKSEIVKSDGSIAPAENGGNQLVFTNLKVGDVIYIDYESYDNATGRFYRDFNFSYAFNGTYPVLEANFGIIYPNEVTFDVDYSNGNVPVTTKKVANKNYKSWKKMNTPALPLLDSYSAEYGDLRNVVRVGTIKSWKEIANWYADLVKKTLKSDKITTNTFNGIFPNGTANLSQEEKARSIYKYIEDNITYSSLDFRQSGYVPQKPARTITTKMGDCKDVSTLFVALADLAGLKSNLVLVLTSDNGLNNIKLPSVNFNHCIVKVEIDGKEHFVELTDKYLPFNAMPMTLVDASALVVSFDKAENEKAKLINIPVDNAIKNSSSSKVEVLISDNGKEYKVTSKVKGFIKAYYNELFSNSITEDIRKKELEEDYNSRLSSNILFQSAKVITNDLYADEMVFQSEFSIPERLQSVGSLKIASIPFLDKVYTRNIIEENTRNYDISYTKYENCKEYNSEIILNIPEGKKFSEIPETKLLNYKDHNYSISFELVTPNSLRINRKVTLPWKNISKEEYLDFKKYVEDVIEIEKQIVGFK
ncbi:transglutaminase domain-containing protein [Flavobacterium soli]|uniref:transglutaminase domain-containing protein n=1 Tax=Flavobacterium soli TaxID=344881 RepID=UPI0003FC3424|nr:transglutaminase domain-containing protein [Flavobacterium soli]